MNTKYLIFWRKFTKYLLLGLSLGVLLFAAQSTYLLNMSEEGARTALADEEDFGEIGPGNVSEPWFDEPSAEAPANVSEPWFDEPSAPAAPAPSCPDNHNYCDTNVNKLIHKHGGYWNGNECVYAFDVIGECGTPPPPAPPPGPACPANEVVRTETGCVNQQLCTRNIHHRNDCSEYPGGWYGCQNSAQCGFTQPTPPPPPTPIPTPVPPVCSSNTTQERSCVNQQLCTFNSTRNSCTGQVTSRVGPFNCQFIQGECGYNPGPSCTPSSIQQQRCSGNQLCTYTITTQSNCSRSESGPRNCFNSTQCGFTPPAPPAAPPAGGNQDVTVNPGPITVTNPTTVNTPPINITNNNPTTVTVNNPAPAPAPARTFRQVSAASAPRVVTAQVAGVQTKELPKTGLPVAAWAALAFIPAGFKMRKIAGIKKDAEGNPEYLWEKRQFSRS